VDGNDIAIDNASNVAANGLLIMNSGYGLFGFGSGNVMLTFRSKKQRTMCESNKSYIGVSWTNFLTNLMENKIRMICYSAASNNG